MVEGKIGVAHGGHLDHRGRVSRSSHLATLDQERSDPDWSGISSVDGRGLVGDLGHVSMGDVWVSLQKNTDSADLASDGGLDMGQRAGNRHDLCHLEKPAPPLHLFLHAVEASGQTTLYPPTALGSRSAERTLPLLPLSAGRLGVR
jgi:hypothetical protein